MLETAWKNGPDGERMLWQGLAQLVVGITHIQRGNVTGAVAHVTQAAHFEKRSGPVFWAKRGRVCGELWARAHRYALALARRTTLRVRSREMTVRVAALEKLREDASNQAALGCTERTGVSSLAMLEPHRSGRATRRY